MLKINLNSLHFKKQLPTDCQLYVSITNPNQNTVESRIVDYNKKENIALFSEVLYLKDIQTQQNTDYIQYLRIEVFETYPNKRILAKKAFASYDIFSKKEVLLQTNDKVNEILLQISINVQSSIQSNNQLFYRQSSSVNFLDDSFSQRSSLVFDSPINQRPIQTFHQLSTQSSRKSRDVGKPDSFLSSEKQGGVGQKEGIDQLFNGILSSFKNGFLELCEKETEKDLDYLDMNQYTYQFVSKLGPVVAIFNYMREVFNWTNTTQTMMFGISVSSMIFYPQVIISLSLLYTYFFTNRVIQFMFQLGIQKKTEDSVIDKNLNKIKNLKKNMIFLQEQMRFYSKVYDQVIEFLYSDDKTQVILNIQKFRNYSIFLVIGMIFIPFKVILLTNFWFALFSHTKYGMIFAKEGFTLFDKLALRFNRFLEKEIIHNYFPKIVAQSLPIPEKKTGLKRQYKRFLIQENQRWWIGKGFTNILVPGDLPEWSDLQGKKQLKKEDFKLPDQNWQWENNGVWIVEKSQKTDNDGWQYAVRFSDQQFFNQCKTLYMVRKRVWYKTCSSFVCYDNKDYDNDDGYQ